LTTVVLDGRSLTIDEVVAVAREGAEVRLAPDAVERMRETRAVVERALARGDAVYGLTTGVGAKKKVSVAADEARAFNRALVANHLVGAGPDASAEIVRATMLRLANALAAGTPGVRPRLAERLVSALNEREHPSVRLLGSLGQADLPAMADLAHGLFAELELEAKEALALVNSNAFSTGMSALALADTDRLLEAMDVAGALDLEAFAANLTLLHPAVAEVRPYPGLAESLARLRALLEGSWLWEPEAARNLQDPLSFRGLPQLHGALRDALSFARGQLQIELNASQENPLVLPDEDRIVSVANFEILPLAAALDFLRIALAPALTTSAERLLKLLQGPLTGLPDGLAPRQGLAENSLSEYGIAAQGLTAEARLLAQPVSFELVTTTQAEGIEDRMTMAPLAARRLAEMVALGEAIVAIELVVAAQAVDLRRPRRLGSGTADAHARVRELVPFLAEGDTILPDLEPVRELIRTRALRPDALR
jgi:histidine ammonia-lyase